MGKLISFSGVDGAGKSTLIKLLSHHLRRLGYRVLVTESMFGYFLLKPFIGGLRRATNSPKMGPVSRNQNPFFKLWFIPAFIDIWSSYLFRVKRMLLMHDYVIADRFYSDLWANLLYYGYCPDWAFESLVNLLPKADHSFWLKADPKIILRREAEFPNDYYFEQNKIYNHLAVLTKPVEINANLKPQKILQQVAKHL